jgi:hypothetical protein
MLVNVSVIDPVGVQVKLLPAVMSKLPSLSVTRVPLAAPEKVDPPEITCVPEKVFVPLELMFPEIIADPEIVFVPDRILPPENVFVVPDELILPEIIAEPEMVLVPDRIFPPDKVFVEDRIVPPEAVRIPVTVKVLADPPPDINIPPATVRGSPDEPVWNSFR